MRGGGTRVEAPQRRLAKGEEDEKAHLVRVRVGVGPRVRVGARV